MNKFRALLGKVLSFLTGGATKAAEIVQRIALEALPIVDLIAGLTPTRSDDEIIALFRRFALPAADYWLSIPPEKRGAALLDAGTQYLKNTKFPSVDIHLIQAGLQLALVQNRSDAKEAGAAALPAGLGEF